MTPQPSTKTVIPHFFAVGALLLCSGLFAAEPPPGDPPAATRPAAPPPAGATPVADQHPARKRLPKRGPSIEGTEKVFYATLDHVQHRLADTEKLMEEATARYPAFQSQYIQGTNYFIPPEVLFLREELFVYEKMKRLLEDGMPLQGSLDYEYSLKMIGKYEFLEQQKQLKMAWDEHLRMVQQAKERVIEVGTARKPVTVP